MRWGVGRYLKRGTSDDDGPDGETPADADADPGAVYYECRACGRGLDGDRDRCPACGGDVAGHLL